MDMLRWLGWAVTTPTGGVVLGGLLAIAGGLAGSILLGRMDDARERTRSHAQHVAAVRAVVFELSADWVVALHGGGSLTTTSAYDTVLLPLFSELPAAVATEVSQAYALIHVAGPHGHDLVPAAPQLGAAQAALRTYATDVLHLEFPPPA